MENPRDENINLIRWQQRRRIAVTQVTCLLVWRRLIKAKLQPENASEMRKRKNSTTEDDYLDTVDGIHHLVAKSFEMVSVTVFVTIFTSCYMSSQARSTNANLRSKYQKDKRSKVDKEVNNIKEVLNKVAKALRKGNSDVEKSVCLPVQEEKIWKLLMDLDIEDDCMDRAYLYLVERPKNVRALIGCPREKRKPILMMMVFGPSYSPGF